MSQHRRGPPIKRSLLIVVIDWTAIVAPLLHFITDTMEWYQGGLSPLQLWLNYLAFLPMPWLLLGIYAVRSEELGPAYTVHGAAMVVGGLLFGRASRRFSAR